jgi:hypothetical protein
MPICFNPEAAERDAAVRERMIAQLTLKIDPPPRIYQLKPAVEP